MIEIKIFNRDELINFNINEEESTHVCLISEGEATLGVAGIKYDGESDIELIFTEMRIDDEFLFDGLVKTIVNYADTQGFEEIVIYDEDTVDYLNRSSIKISENIISIQEFKNRTHCRKV
ncbi:hypothetical protein GC105_05280 [Alkalibaculum sp. M08DMB]|uniref:GNAT family N-acetyltransferase n=1 Tax=Alkalibaculum sporogenes TaxID=2655001 RepID=A0A6A7K767_9FIRM|nr:hypothetical protein [Alkalibaculum sporogenes]MPW25202.1 hypothetical protein [Alkalibaculum sporogenes]